MKFGETKGIMKSRRNRVSRENLEYFWLEENREEEGGNQIETPR